MGPWRNVILCENTQSLRTQARVHVVHEAKGLTCMNFNFSILCMMMGRMTVGNGEIRESRQDEDNLQSSVSLRTHSWCGHGDPREDHLGDPFNCCFLQERETKTKSQSVEEFSGYSCV